MSFFNAFKKFIPAHSPENEQNIKKNENIKPTTQKIDTPKATANKTQNQKAVNSPIDNIYYPDNKSPDKASVEEIELTEKEAVTMGWSYRKKSKAIRITNYHGTETAVIVPFKIGGIKVNELGDKCFANTKVTSVEIPSSVAKIGKNVFNRSCISRVIFSDSLRYIPDETFSMACYLEEVHLPCGLNVIGKRAFYHCVKLKYIALPDSVFNVQEKAFFGSGLEGFSLNTEKYDKYNDEFYGLRDGSAFYATPVQQNHSVIAIPTKQKNKLNVLTVGNRAKIDFPDNYTVTMGKNSVDTLCELNFTKCRYLTMNQPVFRESNPYGQTYTSYSCKVAIKETVLDEYAAFPPFVDVFNSDGNKINGTYKILKDKSGKGTAVTVYGATLLPWSLNIGAEKIRLLPEYEPYCSGTILENAVHAKNLKSIDLGDFVGYEEIFSLRCTELHNVRFNRCGFSGKLRTTVEKHIPPSSLFGKNDKGKFIHNELMKAFTFVTDCSGNLPQYNPKIRRTGYFYDQTVIDKVFKRGYVKLYYGNIVKLNQRDKILIAIDVLRGSDLSHISCGIRKTYNENRDLYRNYLKGHLRYAKKICKEIHYDYPEYSNYLSEFQKEI